MLIALLKTPGEGGVVQLPFPTEAACQAGGSQLTEKFAKAHSWEDDHGKVAHPTVIFVCLETPKP